MDIKAIRDKILKVRHRDMFNECALEIFSFQYQNNQVYRTFCQGIGIKGDEVREVQQIPFLPVELFKNHRVTSLDAQEKMVFRSSGTTGKGTSSHLIFDPEFYRETILAGFRHFYGDPDRYCFVLLIPDSAMNPSSSLGFMGKVLAEASDCKESGFYNEGPELMSLLKNGHKRKLFILGLSFALLSLAEKHPLLLPSESIVMETGGMKGRRTEISREDLHEILCNNLYINSVQSEYGMCELFSQAYSSSSGIFSSPPWMKIGIRDLYDPLSELETGQAGGINITDLANFATCSFIATGDWGKKHSNGDFEVLGRILGSDLKGCNLFFEE